MQALLAIAVYRPKLILFVEEMKYTHPSSTLGKASKLLFLRGFKMKAKKCSYQLRVAAVFSKSGAEESDPASMRATIRQLWSINRALRINSHGFFFAKVNNSFEIRRLSFWQIHWSLLFLSANSLLRAKESVNPCLFSSFLLRSDKQQNHLGPPARRTKLRPQAFQ